MLKSKKMQAAEDRLGRPLESAIPALYNEHGAGEAARIMGVTPFTLRCWMAYFNIRIEHILIERGETVSVVKKEV